MIKPRRSEIESAFRNDGRRIPNSTELRKSLNEILPAVMSKPITKAIAVENPFPSLWAKLADRLAGEIHSKKSTLMQGPEWRLINSLLLVGLIASCRLPTAKDFKILLDQQNQDGVFLPVRGSFLRIPELLAEKKVIDALVPRATSPSSVTFVQEPISDFVRATMEESRKIPNGRGFFHELIPVQSPTSVPSHLWGVGTFSNLVAVRKAIFPLYEWTVEAYLALSCIEQILRSWASHAGVPHLKPSGQPEGVLNWLEKVPHSGKVLPAVKLLYARTGPNIRNRIMHGNLLEIEGKRLEVYLSEADPNRYRQIIRPTDDTYHPENVARLCLESLATIDREIRNSVELIPADLAWTAELTLTPSEIEYGQKLYSELLSKDGQQWADTMSGYLIAVFPVVKQFFTAGLIEWLEASTSIPSLPRFMAMGLIFEALFRLTAHLKGFSVLQKSVRKDDALHFQYRMLDSRANGRCTCQVLDSFVEHVPATDRAEAKKVLGLAVKARNAISHGAVTVFDQDTCLGMGHILIKAVQTLITAGQHHLVREAAYFNWLNVRNGENGHDLEDWDVAQAAIFERIETVFSIRRGR